MIRPLPPVELAGYHTSDSGSYLRNQNSWEQVKPSYVELRPRLAAVFHRKKSLGSVSGAQVSPPGRSHPLVQILSIRLLPHNRLARLRLNPTLCCTLSCSRSRFSFQVREASLTIHLVSALFLLRCLFLSNHFWLNIYWTVTVGLPIAEKFRTT